MALPCICPRTLKKIEITDDKAEAGITHSIKFMDGEMNISYGEIPEDYDYAAGLAELTGAGVNPFFARFNDLLVLCYDVPDSDATAMILLGEGCLFAITAQPVSNEDFAATLQSVFSSICFYDAEAAAE